MSTDSLAAHDRLMAALAQRGNPDTYPTEGLTVTTNPQPSDISTAHGIDPSTGLPPLETDCPDCTGEAGKQMRRKNRAAWHYWNDAEQQVFNWFIAERRKQGEPEWGDFDAWQRSHEYRELLAEQPGELPERGCYECDYTGKRPTPAGVAILDLVRRWTKD